MLTRLIGMLLASLCCTLALADDDPLQALSERFEAQENLYQAARKEAKTDAEHLEAFEKLDPRNVLIDDFLAVEAANRGTTDGVSALYHLMRHAASVGDPECAAAKGRVRAIEIARTHYLEHPQLHFLFAFFSSGAFAPEAEGLLENATRSPDKRVRAAARYQLARFLQYEALLAELVAGDSPAFAAQDRSPAVAKMLAKLKQQVASLNFDPAERRGQALRVVKELVEEDPDSLQTFLMLGGPGNLRVSETDPASSRQQPRTYAELASALQFELEHLQPGCTAPNITGEDASGKQFELSEYRGRVVLLIFSANWCGPCKAMYPDLRKLQAELADAPFAILAVMGDHDKSTVIQDTDSGEIRWRTWFDGDGGPIASKWNVQSWPSIYLIDHTGRFHSSSWQRTYEHLRAAIEPLLAAQQADPSAAELVRKHAIPPLPTPQTTK